MEREHKEKVTCAFEVIVALTYMNGFLLSMLSLYSFIDYIINLNHHSVNKYLANIVQLQ